MINSIKRRTEITEDEKSYMLSIHVEELIVLNLKQDCLCAMVPSVQRKRTCDIKRSLQKEKCKGVKMLFKFIVVL